MDFVFGLPKDSDGNTGIVVFADRLSKMAHLAAVPDSIDGEGTDLLFILTTRPAIAIVSDRDPRFTAKFWKAILKGARHQIRHVYSGSSADRWSD